MKLQFPVQGSGSGHDAAWRGSMGEAWIKLRAAKERAALEKYIFLNCQV